MASALILSSLQLCDGVVFDRPNVCPSCGGDGSGYELRTRRFAVIQEEKDECLITVKVKRFQCIRCHHTFLADAPFYPETRAGSPVIDLCTALAGCMPCYSVSSFLGDIGVMVDRGSVRTYALQDRRVMTTEMLGLRVPVSILHLASLAAGKGAGDEITGSDVLTACGHPEGNHLKPPLTARGIQTGD